MHHTARTSPVFPKAVCRCRYYGDWFNEEAIAWINDVLEQEGFEGRLYDFFDGGQGIILIYGSEEKAGQLGQLLN